MRITLRVKKVYKGDLPMEVQVRTGMGGGDCGASYQTGLDYLVYTYSPRPAELWVSQCSPGGWLGSNYLATELRQLRRERPLKSDLVPLNYWTPTAVARADREREEFNRRFTAATGQICGRVSPGSVVDGESGSVAFLPTVGYSPHGRSVVNVSRDGRFCSDRLGPGGYYLFFTQWGWSEKPESAIYYPGVADRANAAIVEVAAGQVRSDLAFQVPKQDSYAVHGFLSTDDKSGLREDGAVVMLVGLDGRLWRRQTVDFRGSLPLPKVKYFAFKNVLPGHYIALAFATGRGWFTRRVDVKVTTHMKLILLELKHVTETAPRGRITSYP